MGAEEAKRRIVAGVMARHRARIALETACGPGNKNQRARRKAYRVIDQAERAIEIAAAALDEMVVTQDTTINALQ